MSSALRALTCALLTTAASTTCDLGGTWQGGSGPTSTAITVVTLSPTTFLASAAGAWQNASGSITTNQDIALSCCEPGGLQGAVNDACTRIVWNDPPRSVWSRPQALNATISNLLPRRDDTGEIMRVQDGCLANFGGTFYLYGARYQCCNVSEQPACYQACGWRNTTFAVYSSPDLTTWHLESASIMPIFEDASSPHSNTRNAYFEPCVLYSASADHYALWFLSTNTKAVAVSDSPTGPFESVSWDTGLAQGSDAYYWVDEEAEGSPTYVKHNGPPPPGSNLGAHQVSRLAPDLLSVLPNASSAVMTVPALPVPPSYQGSWPTCSEGGGLFKYNKRWYVMAGACCCFCRDGANAYVWATEDDNPLGVYTLQDNVGVMPFNTSSHKYMSGAQQFSVAQLRTTSGVVPVYIGQRFGSADDGQKCHDYQYWEPLRIDASGRVGEMAWVNDFTLELLVGI